MQIEMGTIELTQDIISCQRFVASLYLFYSYSPRWTQLMAFITADRDCVLMCTDFNIPDKKLDFQVDFDTASRNNMRNVHRLKANKQYTNNNDK